MDDALEYLLALLGHWRVLLSLVISALGAVVFVHVFPWFTGLQGIVLGALGFLPGAIWESRAEASSSASSSRLKALQLWVVGVLSLIACVVWGAASAATLPSFFAGLVLLVLVACVWCWSVAHIRSALTMPRASLLVGLAALAYAVAAWLAHPWIKG